MHKTKSYQLSILRWLNLQSEVSGTTAVDNSWESLFYAYFCSKAWTKGKKMHPTYTVQYVSS